MKKDYSPQLTDLQALDPFWLDFWCTRRSEQLKILEWLEKDRLKLSDFVRETKVLRKFIGVGHV
jgi:hypothetical protein